VESYQGAPVDMSKFKRMYTVCGTLPMILPMMTFVLWFMLSGDLEEPPSSIPTVQTAIFAAIAVGAVALAPWVRSLGMRRTGPMTTPNGVEASAEDVAAARIQTACVTGMAMPEIALLLGYVLGFLSYQWSYFIPFAALCAVGWAFMFPRPSQIRQWYARQMGFEPAPSIIH